MIVLSKSVTVVRDHLIHRKRSPFPYEGKALTRLKVGVTANVGRYFGRQRFARRHMETDNPHTERPKAFSL